MSLPPVQSFWRTMRILWFALLLSQLMLGGMLWLVRFGPSAQPAVTPVTPIDTFLRLFVPLAVVEGVISLLLPRWQLRQAARRLGLPPGGRLDDDRLRRLMPAAQAAFILGMGLSESISLLGFVLGFLGARPAQFAPFFAAGFLLAVHRFPAESWLRGQLGASDVL